MSFYPEEVSGREFVIASGGYDRDEVRAFLEIVGREQEALRREIESLRAESAGDGDIGSEIASLMDMTRAKSDEALRLAGEEATAIRARAEEDADRLRQATIEASDRAREDADRYAFETRSATDREVREKLRETNERIEALLDGAAKVRERLFGIDTILASVRTEVAQAAESLEPGLVDGVETAEVPAPPPPPMVIDLRESESTASA